MRGRALSAAWEASAGLAHLLRAIADPDIDPKLDKAIADWARAVAEAYVRVAGGVDVAED